MAANFLPLTSNVKNIIWKFKVCAFFIKRFTSNASAAMYHLQGNNEQKMYKCLSKMSPTISNFGQFKIFLLNKINSDLKTGAES